MESKYLMIGICVIALFILLMFFVNVMESRQMQNYNMQQGGYNQNQQDGGSVIYRRFYYVTHPWALFSGHVFNTNAQMSGQYNSNATMGAGTTQRGFQRSSYKQKISQKQTSMNF